MVYVTGYVLKAMSVEITGKSTGTVSCYSEHNGGHALIACISILTVVCYIGGW
jgi:hypothetical protein